MQGCGHAIASEWCVCPCRESEVIQRMLKAFLIVGGVVNVLSLLDGHGCLFGAASQGAHLLGMLAVFVLWPKRNTQQVSHV